MPVIKGNNKMREKKNCILRYVISYKLQPTSHCEWHQHHIQTALLNSQPQRTPPDSGPHQAEHQGFTDFFLLNKSQSPLSQFGPFYLFSPEARFPHPQTKGCGDLCTWITLKMKSYPFIQPILSTNLELFLKSIQPFSQTDFFFNAEHLQR